MFYVLTVLLNAGIPHLTPSQPQRAGSHGIDFCTSHTQSGTIPTLGHQHTDALKEMAQVD